MSQDEIKRDVDEKWFRQEQTLGAYALRFPSRTAGESELLDSDGEVRDSEILFRIINSFLRSRY
jgi:hypothetical protein